MIPVLYNHAEKSFTSNGLGRLTDCTSCIVTEERNGVFECEFKYPIFGRHYDEIAEGCIIFVTHDNSGIPQPFDIYKRSVPIDGEVTFNAAHVSYRLGKCVCNPFTANSCSSALTAIGENCIPQSEFTFSTDKVTVKDYEIKVPTAAKALLCGTEGSILDVYGTGEYKFDKFQVELYLHRGRDTDVQIRYGKNLADMTDEIDSSGSYTAVVPFWQDLENGTVKMLPELIVVAEDAPIYFDYWTDENGRRISEENGNEFEFAVANIVVVTLDLSSSFETEPTEEQMRQAAQESANAHKLYTQSLSVDFVQLAQSEEYKNLAPLQELCLCDTCEVIYNNRPVRLKVVRTEYDVLKDRYSQIDLGDPPANYADVIMGEIMGDVIEMTPTKTEMATAIKTASDLIKGVNGGNVVFRYMNGKPFEILIMDTDDVATAVNVLRINMNGIGFSRTGVDGNYATAWTLDGKFVADFIQAGTLSADRINGGVLSAISGDSSWNLNTGTFYNVNSGGTHSFRIVGGQIRLVRETGTSSSIVGLVAPCVSATTGEPAAICISAKSGYFAALGYDDNGTIKASLIVHNGDSETSYGERVTCGTSFRVVGQFLRGSTIESSPSENFINYGSMRNTGELTVNGTLNAKGVLSATDVQIAIGGASNTKYLEVGTRPSGYLNFPEKVQSYASARINSLAIGHYISDTAKCSSLWESDNTTTTSQFYGRRLRIRGYQGIALYASDAMSSTYYALAVSGGGYFSGNVSANSCISRSDENLKNIQPYAKEYDEILDELEPVSFTWKSDDTSEHVGLGARKTKAILEAHNLSNSGFVHVDLGDVYGINYAELSVMLLKRVQDQTKQIKDLSARLERLEALLANS